MFIREKNLVLNSANIEVVRKQKDGAVEVTMTSGRTYCFSDPRFSKKLHRAGRGRLFRLLCWIFRR